MDHRAIEIIELDIKICRLLYGTTNAFGTCSAVLGDTGPIKCFNTRATCQVPGDYDPGTVTLRFCRDTESFPRDIAAIASLLEVQYSPATISLGKSLGERAVLTVVLKDHPWSDTGEGYDKYVTERPYSPADLGTFFSKLRARHVSLRGCALRWINGYVGQSLEEMETRHFIVDAIDGPVRERKFSIIAKDVLKLASGDRAMTPPPSNGFLTAAINSSQTNATLGPAGIGDEEYPASGLVNIGGSETCAFTRIGNALTLTRAQLGTTASAHDAQDRVQLVRAYVSQPPSAIMDHVLQTDAAMPASYIPLPEWQLEEQTFLNRTYTRYLAEPQPTDEVLSELIEQACLFVYPDDLAQKIRMGVLRGIPTGVTVFTPDNIIAGTLVVRDQPEKRLSQVITRYGLRHPLLPASDRESYRSQRAYRDYDLELLYGSPVVREINGTWIPPFASSAADRLNSLLVGRFANPPRRFRFSVSRVGPVNVSLGMVARLSWPGITVDATGAQSSTPIQIVRVKPAGRRIEVEAEEMLAKILTEEDLATRQIVVDVDTLNFNLRAVHDSGFPVPVADDDFTVICTVAAGVTVGSIQATPAGRSFDVGDWPAAVTVKLIIAGRLRGKGGVGGAGGYPVGSGYVAAGAGQQGGTALYTRRPVSIDLLSTGDVKGGAGGGGGGGVGRYLPTLPSRGSGGGGGGGAGVQPGAGGAPTGFPGSENDGGLTGSGTQVVYSPQVSNGGIGGLGGNPGAPGAPGAPGNQQPDGQPGAAGGAAGYAIDGISYCTFDINDGVRAGPEAN